MPSHISHLSHLAHFAIRKKPSKNADISLAHLFMNALFSKLSPMPTNPHGANTNKNPPIHERFSPDFWLHNAPDRGK
jgi:hypothetical protein